jgi:hypothetical protein
MQNKNNLDLLFEDSLFLEEAKGMLYETVTFREAFERLSETEGKVLAVFDFDDTLVSSNSRVKIIHKDGTEEWKTPAEYAHYDRPAGEKAGDKLDFSEFDKVIDPEIVDEGFELFKQYLAEPK